MWKLGRDKFFTKNYVLEPFDPTVIILTGGYYEGMYCLVSAMSMFYSTGTTWTLITRSTRLAKSAFYSAQPTPLPSPGSW